MSTEGFQEPREETLKLVAVGQDIADAIRQLAKSMQEEKHGGTSWAKPQNPAPGAPGAPAAPAPPFPGAAPVVAAAPAAAVAAAAAAAAAAGSGLGGALGAAGIAGAAGYAGAVGAQTRPDAMPMAFSRSALEGMPDGDSAGLPNFEMMASRFGGKGSVTRVSANPSLDDTRRAGDGWGDSLIDDEDMHSSEWLRRMLEQYKQSESQRTAKEELENPFHPPKQDELDEDEWWPSWSDFGGSFYASTGSVQQGDFQKRWNTQPNSENQSQEKGDGQDLFEKLREFGDSEKRFRQSLIAIARFIVSDLNHDYVKIRDIERHFEQYRTST